MASARGRRSAGILAFRLSGAAQGDTLLELFLVHPGGPFWTRRDAGAWSIPKGEYTAEEPALQAAQREFLEETGQSVQGPFIELTPLRQAGGKLTSAFAAEAPSLDPAKLRSNLFRLEWPPRSGQFRDFPEVDRAAWYALPEARTRLLPAQRGLLDELAARLGLRA
ncbi:MAG TPA: NUDIX domain-containing protein [Steroidobacteraceae bacterium]|jgi:predicted NUDIX family NTP pyrophosphohydrolase|nr:NUDIX domain-containing protein [Steroidobacteraceae bacterium]